MGSAQEESSYAKQKAKLHFAMTMMTHIRQARREIRTAGARDSDSAVARWLTDYNVRHPGSPIKTARGKTKWTAQQVNDVCTPEPTARAMSDYLQKAADDAAKGYEHVSRLAGIVPDTADIERLRNKHRLGQDEMLEVGTKLGRILRLEERPGDLP